MGKGKCSLEGVVSFHGEKGRIGERGEREKGRNCERVSGRKGEMVRGALRKGEWEKRGVGEGEEQRRAEWEKEENENGGNGETVREQKNKGNRSDGKIRTFRDLHVYQNSLDAAMTIYEISKSFPIEERYSLTDQIRRSSRSVCANIGEAWRKRRYQAAFVSKLNDSEGEAAETQVWLDISLRIGLISEEQWRKLNEQYEIIQGQLVKMISEPEKWCIPK